MSGRFYKVFRNSEVSKDAQGGGLLRANLFMSSVAETSYYKGCCIPPAEQISKINRHC